MTSSESFSYYEVSVLIYFAINKNRVTNLINFPPTVILDTICKSFLPKNVSAILYLFDNEQFGRSTASVQYFFQLAGYLGIPVISWNADNSGLERVSPFFYLTYTSPKLIICHFLGFCMHEI